MKEINERIRQYRRLKNLTQTDIAEMLGIKCSTYSQMERSGEITCERLIKLSEIFNVDVKTLLFGMSSHPVRRRKFKLKAKYKSKPSKPEPKWNKYAIPDLSKREHDHIVCLRNIGVKNRNSIMQTALKFLKKEIKPSI